VGAFPQVMTIDLYRRSSGPSANDTSLMRLFTTVSGLHQSASVRDRNGWNTLHPLPDRGS